MRAPRVFVFMLTVDFCLFGHVLCLSKIFFGRALVIAAFAYGL